MQARLLFLNSWDKCSGVFSLPQFSSSSLPQPVNNLNWKESHTDRIITSSSFSILPISILVEKPLWT